MNAQGQVRRFAIIDNERGSVLLIALLLLVVLTLIGLAAGSRTTVELSIATNDKLHRSTFNAADAGFAWVAANPALYGDDPPRVEGETYAQAPVNISPGYQFQTTMTFNGPSERAMRGKGNSATKLKGYDYMIDSVGFGPANAQSSLQAAAFRVGF